MRIMPENRKWSDFGQAVIFPILEVEKGIDGPGVWGSMETWMERVLASEKCDDADKAAIALQPAMSGLHAAHASRLIPLLATRHDCLSFETLVAARDFVDKYIGDFPGGWEALAEIEGAHAIIEPGSVAAAFQASPSANVLRLLSEAMRRAVFEAPVKTGIRSIVAHVSAGVATVVAAGAAPVALQVALLNFASVVGDKLHDDVVTSELLLGATGVLQHVLRQTRLPQPQLLVPQVLPPLLLQPPLPQHLSAPDAPNADAKIDQGSGQLAGKRRRE